MITFFSIILGIIFVDQITKWIAVIFLKGNPSEVIIEGILRFTYIENRGAAFGMLSNHRWVFLVISTIAIAFLIVYMIKWRPDSKWACVAIAFMAGGGIGNMIDRTILGYVIDFIDFYAFPTVWMYVFNVAASFVCVGAVMLMYYLIVETVKETKAAKAAKALKAEAEENNGDSDVE